MDHCSLYGSTMDSFLVKLDRAVELPQDQLQITFSHAHAASLLDVSRTEMEGGKLIRPYFDRLADQVAQLVHTARDAMQSTSIVYGIGRCSLAANRNHWDEETGQFVCGFNPAGLADDTVVVARLSDNREWTVATVVNCACHPTALGWKNTLLGKSF